MSRAQGCWPSGLSQEGWGLEANEPRQRLPKTGKAALLAESYVDPGDSSNFRTFPWEL